MKVKYYKLREYLSTMEAIDYIHALTCVEMTEIEFHGLMDSLSLPMFTEILSLAPREATQSKYKEVVTGLYELKGVMAAIRDLATDEVFFASARRGGWSEASSVANRLLPKKLPSKEVKDKAKALRERHDYGGIDLYFCRSDIEALAAKMNDEPEFEHLLAEVEQLREDREDLIAEMEGQPTLGTLQNENQRLQKEVEALKAEVERLEAESEKMSRGDDKRQIKNMGKVIYGMAVNKYQYNPELQRNEATGVIVRAMQTQGIQTTAGTIKRYIDTGKTALEEDGE